MLLSHYALCINILQRTPCSITNASRWSNWKRTTHTMTVQCSVQAKLLQIVCFLVYWMLIFPNIKVDLSCIFKDFSGTCHSSLCTLHIRHSNQSVPCIYMCAAVQIICTSYSRHHPTVYSVLWTQQTLSRILFQLFCTEAQSVRQQQIIQLECILCKL